MLSRNIDQIARMCNGTRIIIYELGRNVMELLFLQEDVQGAKIFVSRTMIDSGYPFKL